MRASRPARPSRPPRASSERRRRARHYALRRRDLALDAVAGLLATILLISLTAGLGVLLLLIIPLAVGLVVSAVLERRRARRGPPAHGNGRSPAYGNGRPPARRGSATP